DIDDVIGRVVGDVLEIGSQLASKRRGLGKNLSRASEQQKDGHNSRKVDACPPAHAGNSGSVASMDSAPAARTRRVGANKLDATKIASSLKATPRQDVKVLFKISNMRSERSNSRTFWGQ